MCYCTKLVQERSREGNRGQGVLERANIKLAAVAHSIVVSAFYILARHIPYREPGTHDFDERRCEHLVDRLTRRIERRGYGVTLEPVPAA